MKDIPMFQLFYGLILSILFWEGRGFILGQ